MRSKSVIMSKTFWASLIAMLGVVLGWDSDLQEGILSAVDEITVLVGVLGMLYGRIKAETKLTIK